MMGVIDADTHIAESESMWQLIDQDMRHRRPVMVAASSSFLQKIFTDNPSRFYGLS